MVFPVIRVFLVYIRTDLQVFETNLESLDRHCVIYGVESWSGVLKWILEWNEVEFGVIVARCSDISATDISATDVSATDISATDISVTDILANGHFGHGHFGHGKYIYFLFLQMEFNRLLPFKINMFDHYKLTQYKIFEKKQHFI